MIIRKMNEDDATKISNWKYSGEYDFYSHSGTREEVDRLIKGSYYSVIYEEELIGYYCYGVPAQVPDGNKCGAYDNDSFIDIGLGMKPSLTGKGKGKEFVLGCIDFAKENLSKTKFRLTVAEFNARAIKVYEKIGFKKVIKFERIRNNGEVIKFVTMHLE